MKRRLMIPIILFFLFLGGMTMESAFGQNRPAKPVIGESFAAKETSPYETWKIYLKASDPEGEMRSIFAVVEQAGVGPYSLSITRLKGGTEKEFSGYVYLNFLGPNPSILNFVHLNLTLWIQDRSGSFSEPARFPLSLNVRFVQEAPPPGKFQEVDLGPIMIRLHPVSHSARIWTGE